MAVAFPVGIGLALIIGVVVNYLAAPVGNVALLSRGCHSGDAGDRPGCGRVPDGLPGRRPG